MRRRRCGIKVEEREAGGGDYVFVEGFAGTVFVAANLVRSVLVATSFIRASFIRTSFIQTSLGELIRAEMI